MKCTCSRVPSNVRIIKVGDSEVGTIDLRKVLRQAYRLQFEDESLLKEELLRRVKEKNHIEETWLNLYEEALLLEYHAYAQTQRPIKQNNDNQKLQSPGTVSFLKRIFRAVRNSK
jgi:hypothetical protein